METIYRYEIYGLQLCSTEPLRGLLPGNAALPTDLQVVWRRGETHQTQETERWSTLHSLHSSIAIPVTLWQSICDGHQFLKLQYVIDDRVCDFVFDQEAKRLSVYFPAELTRGRLRSHLVGSVLSSILRLRGTICLHACVVSVNQKAIAFAGRKGDGKSTMAAALVQRGASLLSDDIAAITTDGERFWVYPGEMDIRLLPESAAALYGPTDTAATVAGPDDKSRYRLSQDANASGRFEHRKTALAAIHLFANKPEESGPSIEELPPGERYMALFQHLYGFWLDKDCTHARDFNILSRLANTVPIYRIHRRQEFDQLPAVCDAIIQNLDQQVNLGSLRVVST